MEGGSDVNDFCLFSRRQSVKNRLHCFDVRIDTNDNEHFLVECAVFPATKFEGGGRETDDYPSVNGDVLMAVTETHERMVERVEFVAGLQYLTMTSAHSEGTQG